VVEGFKRGRLRFSREIGMNWSFVGAIERRSPDMQSAQRGHGNAVVLTSTTWGARAARVVARRHAHACMEGWGFDPTTIDATLDGVSRCDLHAFLQRLAGAPVAPSRTKHE